jgi:polyvinyl alcohol dehydrogenase (cytochrome)
VWKTQVGPGGPDGGIQWGSATDGMRIYAAISDFPLHTPYTITSASGQTSTVAGGSWSALDAATGKILWQTADPQGAADLGFVSTANGVVYAGSDAPAGDTMYALDASDGTIAWGYPSGGAVISGAAIVNGSVYWGSGYYIPTGVSNDQLYAFSLPASPLSLHEAGHAAPGHAPALGYPRHPPGTGTAFQLVEQPSAPALAALGHDLHPAVVQVRGRASQP